MSINFKIVFEESLNSNENVVLLRGNLLKYTWNSLKKNIIENSHNSFFLNYNLMLRDNNFFLEIIEFNCCKLNVNTKEQIQVLVKVKINSKQVS